ncbi:hypothetical protein NFI96_004798 [Prochilodus magdalenae]|nr:hypothetical protein NFI96_004798 [Prochilodus magdalenae]
MLRVQKHWYSLRGTVEWNTPPLSPMSREDAACLPGRGSGVDSVSRWYLTSSGPGPLEFYVPVQGYLMQSPIEFGQVRPSFDSDWVNPKADNQVHHSLPSISIPSPNPLSVSPSVPLPFPLGHGTTTLGFAFQGGVIAAADSRSSCSGLVACPASQKILPVHSHLVGTTSGTSADCALWKRILARELRLYQLRNRRRLSTGGAAKLLSHMLHPFKGTELCVAATLCGWDGDEAVGGDDRPVDAGIATKLTGPRVFYVCSDGLRLQGELFSVGSGSPYAYSILDGRVHWGLSVDEAVAVAREAVYRATYRDAYSGNNVDLYHVTAKGWRRRQREDLKEEYYREKERERKRLEERRRETEKKKD